MDSNAAIKLKLEYAITRNAFATASSGKTDTNGIVIFFAPTLFRTSNYNLLIINRSIGFNFMETFRKNKNRQNYLQIFTRLHDFSKELGSKQHPIGGHSITTWTRLGGAGVKKFLLLSMLRV